MSLSVEYYCSLLVDIGSPLEFFQETSTRGDPLQYPRSRSPWQVYLNIKHFRLYWEGSKFSHPRRPQAGPYVLQVTRSRLSPRKSWHISFIAEFTSDIRHFKGTTTQLLMFFSDTLSQHHCQRCGFRHSSLSSTRRPRGPQTEICIQHLGLRDVSLPCCDACPLAHPDRWYLLLSGGQFSIRLTAFHLPTSERPSTSWLNAALGKC